MTVSTVLYHHGNGHALKTIIQEAGRIKFQIDIVHQKYYYLNLISFHILLIALLHKMQ